MRIFEVTNPEEQLGLLKLIIDSTWSAIQKQADEQRAIDATKKLQSKLKAGRTVTPKLRPKQMAPVKAIDDGDEKSDALDDASDKDANQDADAQQDEQVLDSQKTSSINSKPSSTNNAQNF